MQYLRITLCPKGSSFAVSSEAPLFLAQALTIETPAPRSFLLLLFACFFLRHKQHPWHQLLHSMLMTPETYIFNQDSSNELQVVFKCLLKSSTWLSYRYSKFLMSKTEHGIPTPYSQPMIIFPTLANGTILNPVS